MGNRTAKFISALIGSIVAGVPLAAVSQDAPSAPPATSSANAAGDCLASPKGVAPQGQHWHYRLERATKRQCWYLRAEGGKVTQTAQAAPAPEKPEKPVAESAAPQQHAVQDARAEYVTAHNAPAPSTPSAPAQTQPAPTQQAASPSADANAQQPALAGRWPDASTASAAPAAEPSPAPVAVAAQPSVKPAKSAIALAAADSAADKPTGSLQMLLLAIGGALALAGILASIIYRFASGRSRRQAANHRRVNWDNFEPQARDDGHAPWLAAMPAAVPHARQPRPVDFDAARRQGAQLEAIDREIDVIDARVPPARNAAAELDEANIFNGEFEIEPSAPRLAANAPHDEAPADRAEDTRIQDADVDVITTMLERLLNEGPRLSQPSPEAELADHARSRRGPSAARA
ncbi:hypothetical protein [Bradyrhizobium sp. Gha]|uniref:hypothetical protein n=1 Tax=Bradyrhizobium sp. Gha TaxID=1855318 RepID=UPI0008ED6E9E|nr:hypothetical protein [Bradyrhizobium sp. Gha]SFJ48583.1 hypothetical protein SAMN05216525_12659 [Bradyrhizobium sp. Gha]